MGGGGTVITAGEYSLTFDLRNRITITLPQTIETVRDTVTPIEDRRTDVTEEELVQVLGLVMAIFNGEGGFEDETI